MVIEFNLGCTIIRTKAVDSTIAGLIPAIVI